MENKIVMSKTCCITGHRPNGFPWLYGKDSKFQSVYEKLLYERIESYITENNVTDFISGMALGVDMDFAAAVLKLRKKYSSIHLHCAIPCRDQTKLWNRHDVARYNKILKRADFSIIMSEKYTRNCMFERNRYMVDKSDYVFAVWNGERHGGTWYTIEYAKKNHKPVGILNLRLLYH